jgi:signal transduction histidine kinase
VGEEISLYGDRDLLFQAVANLLDNAIKYTPEKGEISVQLQADANHGVRIAVCDNGPGVPQTELNKLCHRYYRTDASRSLPGNGLGLSLVEAIASLHKARLEFTLNKPTGLCVGFSFPEHSEKTNLSS